MSWRLSKGFNGVLCWSFFLLENLTFNACNSFRRFLNLYFLYFFSGGWCIETWKRKISYLMLIWTSRWYIMEWCNHKFQFFQLFPKWKIDFKDTQKGSKILKMVVNGKIMKIFAQMCTGGWVVIYNFADCWFWLLQLLEPCKVNRNIKEIPIIHPGWPSSQPCRWWGYEC